VNSISLFNVLVVSLIAVILSGCSDPGSTVTVESKDNGISSDVVGESLTSNPDRNAYFGDLHVHSAHSFDAYVYGTIARPDDAYRYAKGEVLAHPLGYEMGLNKPLDFYSVTDHAVFLGIAQSMLDKGSKLSTHETAKYFEKMDTVTERRAAFVRMVSYVVSGNHDEILDEYDGLEIVKTAWSDVVNAANRHYEPGKFTTFIGYEYTPAPQNQNLHRNVIFSGSEAPSVPFSRLDSGNPEDLWAWMDGLRDRGIDTLAIPHNSNGSNGETFRVGYFDGREIDDDYSELRMRNEPLVEVTQVKGTSETHPLLSPNDEWSNFEIMPFRISTQVISNVSGSYVREAYLNGLKLEAQGRANPFEFGLIGASDTHNASYAGDESEFYGKVGLVDGNAALRAAVPSQIGSNPMESLDIYPCPETVPTKTTGESSSSAKQIWCGEDSDRYRETYTTYWGASGLTGVWAEQNSRESIYDAFRRKETFATSGPRIQVRFFGGFDHSANLNEEGAIGKAYKNGVPMGGELRSDAEGSSPKFLVWAIQDTASAPLQRAQVIKGWITDEGEPKEQVYDVACSDGLEVDSKTHRCPDNGSRADLTDCSISSDSGAASLSVDWEDPDFDPRQRAIYYVRVLENPTCRWSTWDALASGVSPRPDFPATIQERAWSSPIWYRP
jgi:hypothetical protein